MADIRQGYYVQLVNRSTGRIVLAVATDELTPAAFLRLWDLTGNTVYNALELGRDMRVIGEYELRISQLG